MADEQPKLLNGGEKKPSEGPVFDFGPGWGFYVTRWLRKYLFKIILPVIIIVVAAGLYVYRNGTENDKATVVSDKIAVTVVRGDSRTVLARKALVNYLKGHPEKLLSGGQKIFIEEKLKLKLNGQRLIVGEVMEFAIIDVETAVAQAKQLTPLQLEAWEKYAKGIKF